MGIREIHFVLYEFTTARNLLLAFSFPHEMESKVLQQRDSLTLPIEE